MYPDEYPSAALPYSADYYVIAYRIHSPQSGCAHPLHGASDILKTVLEPTLNELAILGGIVVLRTILSVFLNREIKDLEAEGEKEQ